VVFNKRKSKTVRRTTRRKPHRIMGSMFSWVAQKSSISFSRSSSNSSNSSNNNSSSSSSNSSNSSRSSRSSRSRSRKTGETTLLSIASRRDVLSSVCSYLGLDDVVRLMIVTRNSTPTIFPTKILFNQIGRRAISKNLIATKFLDSLVFDKVTSLKQLRGLFYFLKSLPSECMKKRKKMVLHDGMATFQGATKVAEGARISLPYKPCVGSKSCQKVVFWECAVCDSACNSCSTHCLRCYECDAKVCEDCCFDTGLCFMCGYMCEGCDEIFSFNHSFCYECLGKGGAPCLSNLGPRCVDCSVDIHICGECSETYCEACEQVNFCETCQDSFCAGCKEVVECSSCTRVACVECDPTFYCDECEEHFCTVCKVEVHDL
jgi:hypothetical protein